MSELEAQYVKRGLWTNVEKGPVMGRTITTDMQSGTIVIALLAVLASLGMSHLWNIITFLNHQLRADGKLADGLFWQQQALLRSLPAPSTMLADSIKLWWLWRNRSDYALARSIFYILLSIAFGAGTLAVGVFSSYVLTSTNIPVLVNSPYCGPLDIDPAASDLMTTIIGLRTLEGRVSAVSRPFAEDCYQNETILPARCNAFIRPNIFFSQERVGCPFAESLCKLEESPGFRLDSGLVDLNGVFGLNLESKDRIKFRRRTTCAVLRTEGHSSVVNASDYPEVFTPITPSEEVLLMHYVALAYESALPNGTTTFRSLLRSNVTDTFGMGYQVGYGSPGWAALSDINLFPELDSDKGDLVLFFLENNLMGYGSPVDDPFFSAHKPSKMKPIYMSEIETWYFPDFPIAVIGCTEQYEFCFARSGAPDFCSGLTSLPEKLLSTQYSGASQIQLAALQLMLTSSVFSNLAKASQNSFKAADLVGNGNRDYLASLPDDQWIQEIVGWESYVWASLQTYVADYAIGPAVRETSAQAYVRNQTTTGEKQLCGMQRMRKPGGFININVFGLAFVIAFALVVTVLDLMLLRFSIFFGRFRRAMSPRIDRWIQDGVFQLQRRAYEARGEGIWKNRNEEIPVTWGKEGLCELPLESEPGSRSYTLHSSATDTTAVTEEFNQGTPDRKSWMRLEK